MPLWYYGTIISSTIFSSTIICSTIISSITGISSTTGISSSTGSSRMRPSVTTDTAALLTDRSEKRTRFWQTGSFLLNNTF